MARENITHPVSSKEYYDSISSSYDGLYAAEQLDKLAKISFELRKRGHFIDPSWSLLDVGCGTGISTAFFSCAHRVGVDPSPELIKKAESKFSSKDIHFMKGTAEDLQGQKQFDLVISITAIQNFTDIEQGITNMLHHGKRFVFTLLKNSIKVSKVRSLLPQFEEIDIGKDIMFIKF